MSGFAAANTHLASRGVQSSKFDTYGDTHTGTLVEGDVVPQTDPNTGAPKFKADGVTPIMQLVITWDTDARDPAVPNDNGRRKLYCSWRLESEIKRAVRAAGAEGLEEGGVLTVKYVREERVANQPGKAKIYEAEYVPPKAFIGGTVNTATGEVATDAGVDPAKIATAKSLWAAGQTLDLIAQVTGLEQGEVEKILDII